MDMTTLANLGCTCALCATVREVKKYGAYTECTRRARRKPVKPMKPIRNENAALAVIAVAFAREGEFTSMEYAWRSAQAAVMALESSGFKICE